MPADPSQAAWDAAVRLLARRNHARAELAGKLRQREFSEPAIETALAACDRYGYLDDEETARQFFRELRRKGNGPLKIRRELARRGLTGDGVDQMLADYAGGAQERAAARELLEKRRARYDREPDPRKRREKIQRFLQGRGFTGAVIRELLEAEE
jgi:regulatory protein